MTREKYSLLDRLIIPDYDTPGGVSSGNLKFDTAKCKECGICISICPGVTPSRYFPPSMVPGGIEGAAGRAMGGTP